MTRTPDTSRQPTVTPPAPRRADCNAMAALGQMFDYYDQQTGVKAVDLSYDTAA
ncbi:hypothetical protein [Paracoccus contaminans]|uniref:hypothetical protein n=1 Tax=Paracoccus contaminans TaxID=1945662 RepID=UPI0012F4A337|nr:hypothetical protein [Paracoccus contaminans]